LPWCDDCSKFWNPPQLAGGANCPTCGRSLVTPVPTAVAAISSATVPSTRGPARPPTAAHPGTAAKAKGAPWHFKLLVVGVTGYMIYRIYWLIEWLPKHI
jgi:hypothetical protein